MKVYMIWCKDKNKPIWYRGELVWTSLDDALEALSELACCFWNLRRDLEIAVIEEAEVR